MVTIEAEFFDKVCNAAFEECDHCFRFSIEI